MTDGGNNANKQNAIDQTTNAVNNAIENATKATGNFVKRTVNAAQNLGMDNKKQ